VSEHNEQAALITWANYSLGLYPELKWLFAIPNGGQRGKAQAGKLKAEGVKPGVFDLCLPVRRGIYSSLWIEMKYGKNRLTTEQSDFQEFIEGQGGYCVACWSWLEAQSYIIEYLGYHNTDVPLSILAKQRISTMAKSCSAIFNKPGLTMTLPKRPYTS
jgi:hypothetical protein